MNRNAIVTIVIVAVLVLGGSVYLLTKNSKSNSMTNMNSNTNSTPAQAHPSATTSVSIQNYAFGPTDIKVKKGTTVTWTNQDMVEHTVTADSGNGPKSELFGKGKTYTYTYDAVGTFAYHCQPHPYMKGTVTVTN